MIKELDSVVLKSDLPELGLRIGDIGTGSWCTRLAPDMKWSLLR